MIGTVSYKPGFPSRFTAEMRARRTVLYHLTRKGLRKVSWRAFSILLWAILHSQVSFVTLFSPRHKGSLLMHAPLSGVSGRRRRSDLKRKSVGEAIEWLNSPSNAHPDKAKIELYLEKRTAHGNSFKHKDHSYKQALDTSKRDPRNGSVEEQRAAYDTWVAENYKRLNGAVQAAHMDWVTTANKADVEYHLSIVDLDLDRAVKKVLESQVIPSSRPLRTILIGLYRRHIR